jgi:hypothetical protein
MLLINVQEKTCSDFTAGSINKTPSFVKLDETGVLGMFCARHGVPVKFVNMYTGERFLYGLELVKALIQDIGDMDVTIFYDIACRFKKQLNTTLGEGNKVRLLVPSFHAYAHSIDCLRLYHQTRNEGTGRVEGETSERCWAYLGRFHSITKEMSKQRR